MKETLYYVLKYEDRYYAPYQTMEATSLFSAYPTVETLTSTNKKLAVRFGCEEVAQAMREQEVMARVYDHTFDAKKCRVVKVVKKTPSVH